MRGRDWRLRLLFLSAVLLLQGSIPGAAQKWLTFDGKEPLIVADGGHNMIYPHSSIEAFRDAKTRGLPTTLLLCDARLTKDNVGICLPDINMKTCTTIEPDKNTPLKNYTINGVLTTGLFTIDYTFEETFAFFLTQSKHETRNRRFDGDFFIPFVDDIQKNISSARFWLNIQHDKFYTDHKLNMTQYLLNTTLQYPIDYVSSPEAAFLRKAVRLVNTSQTQIIFRFLEKNQEDPSTGQTYGSLLDNLTSIKSFASGIIVPKSYIWPVSENLLLPSEAISSVVLDAHKAGLKVFVSGFANSILFAHNYSYDPFKEYLSYADNGVFSVDGFLTDASVTASGAIGCLAHTNDSAPSSGKPIIISLGGSSGIFPPCTNLAYEQAIEDKADYIDCPVQVTKDGRLVCLIDIDLLNGGTTIAQSDFATATSIIPAIKSSPGIYTFNLTWAEIQTNAKPQIIDRFPRINRTRHPENKNSGAFITLADFLDLAQRKPPRSGILIGIEFAPFLIGTLGVDVIGDVLKALSSSNLTQSVIIQSTDSSVLKKIRSQAPPSYQLMYKIDEITHDIEAAAVKEIASFASLVAMKKESLYIERSNFLMNWTQITRKLQAENLTVFAYDFYNEVIDVWWDAYGDPIAEINAYVFGAGVDGIFSEFPSTAAAFKRSRCTGKNNNVAPYWVPVRGNQLGVKPDRLDEVAPVAPPVGPDDVAEPPLPPLAVSPPPAMPPTPAEAPTGAAVSVLLVVAVVSLLLV